MIEDKQLESLLDLPATERLKLAQILIDSTVEARDPTEDKTQCGNGLMSFAGRYAGGPGNTSDRNETILETEVDSRSGLSVR